ncbi:ubiquitin-like protein, partial [Massarina eburnea CBS 473.64]
LQLEVSTGDTVQDIMEDIYEKKGTPPDEQRLVYCGRQLESTRSLGDYNVVYGSTLVLYLRVIG